ncbi:MAG: KEOPS complex subunit Cgi121 [Methanobacteriota archaeon]
MTFVIVGVRATVHNPEVVLAQAREWAAGHGGEVLLADARCVFGRDHMESAARHALRAKEAGRMAARSLPLEALRYLAGERQVSDAIRVAGIRAGTSGIAILGFGDLPIDAWCRTLGWSVDEEVLEPRGKSLDALEIGGTEASTVPEDRRHDLALERVALLDVRT